MSSRSERIPGSTTTDPFTHEQVVFCQRPGHRPAGDHRDPLHRPRSRARRHPLLPVRVDGRRARGRARPLARDGLQERAGRPRPRRRQGGHHRRPAPRQVARAAARLRPLRGVASAAATSPPATSAPTSRHGRRRARRTRFVTGRSVAHGGAGDSLGAHRIRRLPGHAGRGRAPWGTPSLAGRRVGVAGVGKVGRHLVRHLLEDGASVVDHRRESGTRSRRCSPSTRGGGGGRPGGARSRWRWTFLAERAGRRADRRHRRACCRRRSCAARPTTSWPSVRAGRADRLAERGILYAPDYVVNAAA